MQTHQRQTYRQTDKQTLPNVSWQAHTELRQLASCECARRHEDEK